MITALLFLFILACSQARHPTCPNNQEALINEDGSLLQCLPSSSETCGPSHTCYFSGMNYMCCPSNEPNPDNLPSCPKTSLTVLDSHGLPLKCSPRTRQCPQDTMFCTDVGLAFICCEKAPPVQASTEIMSVSSVRKVLKRRKMKTTTAVPETESEHDCPDGSIGILDHYGNAKKCTAETRCTGFNQFCHGGEGGPICCERLEYALNRLDPLPEPTTFSPLKARPRLTNVPLVSGSVERRPNILSSGENLGHKSRVNALPIAVAISPSRSTQLPTLVSIEETTVPTITETETIEPLVVFTTTEEPTTSPRARAHAIRTHNIDTNFAPSHTLSRGKASELLNGEEKKAMAQRFLMHQIRNGWPYDDRFYRPDMDAFTNEQRQDIAKLRFIDN